MAESTTIEPSDTKTIAQQVQAALHPADPYVGFDAAGRQPTPAASNRGVFLPVIESLKPPLAVEVGCWKGGTSVVLAEAMRRVRPGSCLVCIDTWLGSIEHFTNPPSPAWDLRPTLEHGFPRLYEHWMTTIVEAGVQDTVVPLANTSLTAAKWFARMNLRPAFVFIDAGHDDDDVTSDINAWWPLLAPGGVMAGDDWSPMWPGVEAAVTRFTGANGLKAQVSGPNWLLQKPAAMAA